MRWRPGPSRLPSLARAWHIGLAGVERGPPTLVGHKISVRIMGLALGACECLYFPREFPHAGGSMILNKNHHEEGREKEERETEKL